MGIPHIFRSDTNTRKLCKLCGNRIKKDDIVLDYVSSVYGSSVNVAWIHLTCLLDSAPKDCEFEMLLKILSEDRK